MLTRSVVAGVKPVLRGTSPVCSTVTACSPPHWAELTRGQGSEQAESDILSSGPGST